MRSCLVQSFGLRRSAVIPAAAALAVSFGAYAALAQQVVSPARNNWAVNHTLVTPQGQVQGRSGPVAGGAGTPFQRIDPRLYDQSYIGVTQYRGPYTLQPGMIGQQPSGATVVAANSGNFSAGGGATALPAPGERDALGRRETDKAPSIYASGKLLQELNFGLHYHDAAIFGNREEDGVALSFEAIFRTFEFLDDIGAPRPTIGGYVNTAGDTSYAYAGVTWTWDDVLTENLFVNLFLGLTVHNGGLTRFGGQSGKEFGSRIIFREAAEFGYRFGGKHGISLLVDHISNANTSGNNEGLDSVGIRYGYRF